MGLTSSNISSRQFSDHSTNNNLTEGTLYKKIINFFGINTFFRKFSLRIHKFSFQWDLFLHLFVCILSLTPFFFTGQRSYSAIPLGVWLFYNILFLIGHRTGNLVIPGLGKFKHSYKVTIEDFFSPKLLPVLSISFLLVTLTLTVTGHRLGGPPLCYRACGPCLSVWDEAVPLNSPSYNHLVETGKYDHYRVGCGYANGKELLGYYTMAQTSFLLFFTVMVAMAVCLAWRVADEELEQKRSAEAWLKKEDVKAYELRNQMIQFYGNPASSIRPEGSAVWIFYGVVAALSFTLLGWHNWYVLPPSPTATLLIVLNLLTILMSTLILHLGFFGRLLALYKRNFLRVECLTRYLADYKENDLVSWWNCRNFVLNDDLSLEYDIGGLAVSAAFLMGLCVFAILMVQFYREGHTTILEPPGSYCAYACLYITCCLIKLFTLATNTYEEQHRHIAVLHNLSHKLMQNIISRMSSSADDRDNPPLFGSNPSGLVPTANENQAGPWVVRVRDCHDLQDDGPLDIDDEDMELKLLQEKNPTSKVVTRSMVNKSEEDNVLKASFFSNWFGSSRKTADHGLSIETTKPDPTGDLELNMKDSPDSSEALLRQNSNDKDHPGKVILPYEPSSLFDGYGLVGRPPTGLSLSNPSTMMSSSQPMKLSYPGGHSPRFASALSPKNSVHNIHPHSSMSPKIGMNHHKQMFEGHAAMASNLSIHNESDVSMDMNPSTTTTGKLNRVISMNNTNIENYQQTITEIVIQIRKYDPYPCIFGIPVMPALFTTCKFYIFICFMLIGTRTMVSCLRQL